MATLVLLLLPILYAIGMYKFSAWRAQKEIASRSSPLQDGKIRRLNLRLARAAEISDIRAEIYEIHPINGLATPNGRIYITRGLFDHYRSGDVTAEEISTVIAHEMGHVALGHAQKRFAVFASENAVRIALGLLLGRFLPGLSGLIATSLVGLFGKRMSRQDEFEADAFASALLVKAGIGTSPQKSLLGKLESITGGSPGQVAWLMSHPKTESRIDAIKKRDRRWSRRRGTVNRH